jgi:hypothetical protein
MVGRTGLKSKKGSIQDLFLVGGILVFFAIATLLGFKVMSEWKTQTDSMSNIPAAAKVANARLEAHFSGVLDNTFLTAAVFLAIGVLILAALVRVHPIFIPIFIIALIFLIFFAGILSNIYQEMAATSQLAPQANQLVMIGTIMGVLPLIIGIFGTIIMIIMYKNWKAVEI